MIRSRVTVVWLLLVFAAAISWEIGRSFGFNNLQLGSIASILIAFVKIRFVMLDFMELRHAPLPMRMIAEVWVIAICTALVILYLRGSPF